MNLVQSDSRAQVFPRQLRHLPLLLGGPLLVFTPPATCLCGQGFSPLPQDSSPGSATSWERNLESLSLCGPIHSLEIGSLLAFCTQEQMRCPGALQTVLCGLNARCYPCNQSYYWNCDQCSLKLRVQEDQAHRPPTGNATASLAWGLSIR